MLLTVKFWLLILVSKQNRLIHFLNLERGGGLEKKQAGAELDQAQQRPRSYLIRLVVALRML